MDCESGMDERDKIVTLALGKCPATPENYVGEPRALHKDP